MKTLVSLALGATMALGGAAYSVSLDGLLWKNRPLLLFAGSRSDASLDRQVDILRERRPDLRERDMVVLQIAGNEDVRMAIGYADIPRGSNRELRKRFGVTKKRGLTVILVGKDGTEKARWEERIDPDVIFDIIDAMPMRQREVEEGEAASTN